jgi:hypothetical protein
MLIIFKSFFTYSLYCGSPKENNYIAGGERIFLLGVPDVITHFTISITSVYQERIYVNGLITLYASVSIIFFAATHSVWGSQLVKKSCSRTFGIK